MKQRQLFQKPMLLLSLLLATSFCFSQVNEAWVARYNGPGNSDDYATKVATDSAGNVYVTGNSFDDSSVYDFTTIKYNAAGAQLWVARYDGPANSYDYVSSLVVDGAGNVYVTGRSDGTGTGFDYATIKYDGAGNQLWVARYNGPGNNYDEPTALAVDGAGNVYVTGESDYDNSFGANDDYATIKYDATGNELWVARYNGPSNHNDRASGLAVDAAGNVYVTGSTQGADFNYNYATIKYNAAGTQQWLKQYNGSGNYDDYASLLTVDASGNVYVTGSSYGTETAYDYATIKYNTAGSQLWVKRYNAPGSYLEAPWDFARSLAVDAAGNVYVTGTSPGTGLDHDYATVKYDASGNELWAKRYNGSLNSYDEATALVVDGSGNVYVTGVSRASNNFDDYATVKYNAAGAELWVKRYNGPENNDDYAFALAVNATGNVYVTGRSTSSETGRDYTTIKYEQTDATLTLINADTDGAIGQLQEGDTINLAAFSTRNLNIRVNTDPAVVGSVVFKLSGAETRNHTENIRPYALFGDNNNGDYYPWIPTNGAYTLTATPYTGKNGRGAKGVALIIHFYVLYQAVDSLILVNAITDQDIKTLKNGDVINLASLPTTKLNIRAAMYPDTVGSVVFNLDNGRYIVQENLAPYAIGGDIKGDYRAWTLPVGNHTLTATPYERKNGRGKKGKAHSISFTVVTGATVTQANAANDQQKPGAEVTEQRESLKAVPNPFAGQTTIRFSVPRSGYTTVQVYDGKGTVVARLYQAYAEGGKGYTVPFNSKQLNSGVYVLRLATGKQVQSVKLVLIR